MDEGNLFDWGNAYVRPTDPETSHEAEAELDVEGASFEALAYFISLDQISFNGITAAEFEQYIESQLLDEGWDREQAYRRAESLRRRLTDLEKKYQKIRVGVDGDGKVTKREKRQIYYMK